MIAMHSQDGSHFLGLRQGLGGGYEIVYEAASTGKRLIWQIRNSLVTEGGHGRPTGPAHLPRDIWQAFRQVNANLRFSNPSWL